MAHMMQCHYFLWIGSCINLHITFSTSASDDWRVEQAHLVVQLAQDFHMYPMMHFGPGTARALRANVTSLASSAHHQCVAFNFLVLLISMYSFNLVLPYMFTYLISFLQVHTD